MKTRVWEFPLAITYGVGMSVLDVMIPEGAQLLAAQTQGSSINELMLWALVEVDAPMVPRKICILETDGHDAPEQGRLVHISTCQQFGGRLVWHVFEILNVEH